MSEQMRETLERVRALADSWETAPPRLTELAKTMSAGGDDSLSRALAVGRAYATALRAALDPAFEVCIESCAGQSWTGIDQAWGTGKVWRCDTCGRIVSQDVSNPL